MNSELIIYFFAAFLDSVVSSCAATTSTTTPTTTTTASACTTCTEGQVTFDQASGTIQIDTSGILSTASDGCLTLTATCTADSGYYAFMQFNVNQGGPAENSNMGRTINALLNCVDGNWVYTSDGVSRIITEVSCNQAPDA